MDTETEAPLEQQLRGENVQEAVPEERINCSESRPREEPACDTQTAESLRLEDRRNKVDREDAN